MSSYNSSNIPASRDYDPELAWNVFEIEQDRNEWYDRQVAGMRPRLGNDEFWQKKRQQREGERWARVSNRNPFEPREPAIPSAADDIYPPRKVRYADEVPHAESVARLEGALVKMDISEHDNGEQSSVGKEMVLYHSGRSRSESPRREKGSEAGDNANNEGSDHDEETLVSYGDRPMVHNSSHSSQ